MSLSLRKQEIASRFSVAAPEYSRHAGLQQRAADQLLTEFHAQGKVLDLGCGNGRESLLLSARDSISHVVAADIAQGMLDTVPTGDRISTLAADAEALPLPDASLDGIFSNFALQWCESAAVVCPELRRVLRLGGQLAFSVPGPQSLSALRVSGLLHINRFASATVWLDALQAAGFTQVRCHSEMLTEYHAEPRSLLGALKAIGANTRDDEAHTQAHAEAQTGLRGRRWLAEVSAQLESRREPAGLPFSYQVLYFTATAAS
jgi:malonyl-CoA O-methyltransferase